MRALLYLVMPVLIAAAVDPDLPSSSPTVRAIFPHGLQRGTSAEIELSGQNLHDAVSIEFAGRGVRGDVLSSLGTKIKVKVTAAPDAEVGRRDFRLTTKRGVYVGVFDIGSLPEVLEKESNDDYRKPQPVTLPLLVNGTLGNEDWDHFRFHASTGETMVFDVSATRHGSRLDSDVAVLDGQGRELAWNDDTTIFGDPHIEYTFEKEGDYIVRVGSLNGGGDYRLTAGRLPYVNRAFPAGLQAGASALLTLSGTHLDGVDEVWIGDRAVKGRIVSKSSKELKVRFRVPSNLKTGPSRVHASAHGIEVATPTEIRISGLPETTVVKPGFDRASAIPVAPSSIVNGVIEQPGATHYYRFIAKAGEHYTFRSESMKLGYHMDPTITLLDAQGNKLAYADDPGADERSDEYQLDVDLSHTFKAPGTYYVAIRDGMYRGGGQILYRLTLERMQPDFVVEVREPVKSLYQGQEDTIQVRVRRRAGWNVSVDVWAEGLPPSVVVDRQTVAPTDSIVKDTCGVDRTIDGTIALLRCRVEPSVQGRFDLKIKARGVMNGIAVEREAVIRYPNLSAGYTYGPMQVQRAQMTITAAPAAILGTPETVTLAPGKDRKVKVTIRRFGDAKQSAMLIRARQKPSGATIGSVAVEVAAKEVQLTVAVSPQAVSGSITLEAVSGDGKVMGESAPFWLEVK